MKFEKFVDFDRYGDDLYARGKYVDVLNLFQNASEVLSKEAYETHYFLIMSNIASLHRRAGRMDAFYDVVKQLITNGYACGNWMTTALLKMDHEGLPELLDRNRLLIDQAQRLAKMTYKVCLPGEYSSDGKHPVFFVLHGDGADGNIHNISHCWTPKVFDEHNFITVYVQSSQVYCHGGFQWNRDVETARKDILQCFSEVSRQYSLDTSQMYVGGFSGGAMIAIDFALADVIPLKGFISLCPGSVNDYYTLDRVESATLRGVRGVILEGELDLEGSVQELIRNFDVSGLKYKYAINTGVGHVCPKDLTDKLHEAMAFILEQ